MASLFAPKTPKIEQPETAPTPDDNEIEAARRRRVQIAQATSGVRAAQTSKVGQRETLG